MRFAPKSDTELQELGLMPEGIYSLEVTEAQDKVSKSGNEMIALKLTVNAGDHSGRPVFDYLLESMGFKLKHFTEAASIPHKYTDGSLNALDCMGKLVKAHIVISPPKDGYAAKNSVKDYVVKTGAEQSFAPSAPKANVTEDKKEEFDQDLPF